MKVWLAIYRPNGYDGSTEDDAMGRAIDALNDAMVEAGVRVFVGGLRPPEDAVSIPLGPDQPPLTVIRPYQDVPDHVGGFWVLEVSSMEEGMEWAKKAAVACRAGVEVRPFW